MNRENNYDVFRGVCCIGVIFIHVSMYYASTYVNEIKGGIVFDDSYRLIAFFSCFYESLGRFAVGGFLMLSGAFLLDNIKTKEYKHFYTCTVRKFGIPTALFSVLYIVYQCVFENSGGVLPILKKAFTGAPMYHMWYMFMFLMLMILTPILYRFKESVNEKEFFTISILFFAIACFSRWNTRDVRLEWDLGQAFEYSGFLMMGYCIRKRTTKNRFKGICLIFLSVFLLFMVGILEYRNLIQGISESDLKYKVSQPYCPVVALATLAIFFGFSAIRFCESLLFKKISKLSFYIYLWHAGVWEIIHNNNLFNSGIDFFDYSIIWRIPIYVLIVFGVSLFLSILTVFGYKVVSRQLR